MTRTTTSAARTAASAGSGYQKITMAVLNFDPVIRVHSGVGNLTWNSNIVYGVGSFGGMSSPKEGVELENYDLELTLSGLKAEYLSIALNQSARGKRAYVYEAFMDQAVGQIIDAPFTVYVGRMVNKVIRQGSQRSISVRCESIFADWDRPAVFRYTNEIQQARFPGDKGFEYVAQMVEKELLWGRS